MSGRTLILPKLSVVVAGAIGVLATSAQGFEIDLRTGGRIEAKALVRTFPAAVQLRLPDGSLRMVRLSNVQPYSIPVLAKQKIETEVPVVAAVPEPELPPLSVNFDIVNVGSKSSTKYSYFTSWGSNIRTTTSASIHELRITLRNRPALTVTVVTVIGGQSATEQVELVQNRDVPVRLEIGGKKRTITDLRYFRYYRIDRQAKDDWFVQVLHGDNVLFEEGVLPEHVAGTPLLEDI
ncbi:MAG: hypothetical protein WA771_06385 [Chthoniobacterales bacterium]